MTNLFKQVLLTIIVLSGSLIVSCEKDDEELYSLEGTVWIHQFRPEDNIANAAGEALIFGRNKVDDYALDSEMKVLWRIGSRSYKVRGNTLIIGEGEHELGGYCLKFQGDDYYRSDLKPSDVLIR